MRRGLAAGDGKGVGSDRSTEVSRSKSVAAGRAAGAEAAGAPKARSAEVSWVWALSGVGAGDDGARTAAGGGVRPDGCVRDQLGGGGGVEAGGDAMGPAGACAGGGGRGPSR